MYKAILSLLAALTLSVQADSKKIFDKDSGLKATVLTFPKDQNKNFAILDCPDKATAGTIRKNFDPKKHQLMINGGYFNPDWSPTGYCKIDGKILAPKINPKLSGFIAIDQSGKITLLTHGQDLSKYPTVLQSGPHELK